MYCIVQHIQTNLPIKEKEMMKKYYLKFASLVLFFATSAAIGMETTGKVYAQNRLISQMGRFTQGISITEKSSYYFANNPIFIEPGKMESLGNISQISNIGVVKKPEVGIKYLMKGTTGRILEGLTTGAKILIMGFEVVDITDKFFEFLKSPNYKGKDIVISFDWLYPNAYMDTSVVINFENKE